MIKKSERKYEVRVVKEWTKCKKAILLPSGWLHYELYDGVTGIARPINFREQNTR